MKRSGEVMLSSLEAEYRSLLMQVLKGCANGGFGVFGQNQQVLATLGKRLQERLAPDDVEELLELGSSIEKLRDKLGHFEPFDLHERLLHTRASFNADNMSEAKLARAWLGELQRNPTA